MYWIRRAARFVFVVVVLVALDGGQPSAASPPERSPESVARGSAHRPTNPARSLHPSTAQTSGTEDVVEAYVAAEGDEASRPRRSRDEAQPVRRALRAPLRNPWSVGVRALWRSFGVSTGGGDVSFRGSCLPSGACSPRDLRSEVGKPVGPATGNRHAVEGVAFYAGRLVTTGVEIGAGIDLTTHPVVGIESMSSLGTPVGGLRELSAGEHAAQVLTGDRAMQVDLAGRLTYRFGDHDAPAPTLPVGRPYLGFGAGVSRYFPGIADYTTFGLEAERGHSAGVIDHALFEAWTPNLQLHGGFTVRFPNIAPMLDIELRYVRAELYGLDLGGFRVGTGVRYRF